MLGPMVDSITGRSICYMKPPAPVEPMLPPDVQPPSQAEPTAVTGFTDTCDTTATTIVGAVTDASSESHRLLTTDSIRTTQNELSAAHPAQAAILWTFAITLFASAMLLFLVQPMVGKMILPLFGGTPATWNTCMLFFQAVLLVGYAYSHVTTSWLGVRKQAVAHLLVICLPVLVLPITISHSDAPSAEVHPVGWLLMKLLMVVGLPFFVVSTTGPLLQKWFAVSGHPAAKDPYFLYGASNAGSLLALLAYPLWLEPLMTLSGQSEVWRVGYGVLIVMIVVCAWLVIRSQSETAPSDELVRNEKQTQASSIDWRIRGFWIFAAFVPSSLMLGVTTHITSNLAPIPLLWVLPLALYLLTFVIVFSRKPIISHSRAATLMPYLLIPLVVFTFVEFPKLHWITIAIHLAAFFVATLVCHGRLAQSRPAANHLTEFYLWMSFGGVLGGVFNALVAPSIFSGIVEYPLAVMFACLLLPKLTSRESDRAFDFNDVTQPLLLVGLAVGLTYCLRSASDTPVWAVWFALFAPLAIVCFAFKERPIRFALGIGVFFATVGAYRSLEQGQPMEACRNFFGVKRVVAEHDGGVHKLIHGTTNHGMQFTDDARRGEPLAYYHRSGPLGDVFKTIVPTAPKTHVGIIGLGAGAIAAYAKAGQSFRFYEIDPDVERIARDPNYFTFLADSEGTCDVVLGDGRLTMAREADDSFDILILDAFSSDAIPAHLLTREALQLYLKKLKPNGVMAFHVSNRYLDLIPLLASLAEDAGMVGLSKQDAVDYTDPDNAGRLSAEYVVMAHAYDQLAPLKAMDRWQTLHSDRNVTLWTDQRTSILSLLR